VRKNRLPNIVYDALAGLGLGISALLLYEYTSTAQVCGPGGGCAAIRASSYASIAGVPTPLFGIVFFVVAMGLRAADARKALPVWLAGGAIAGVAFFAIQAFVIEAFCKLCIVADVSAIGLLAVWALALRKGETKPGNPLSVVPAVAAILPFAIGFALADRGSGSSTGNLPQPIAAEQRDGVVTVVEFLDFQCPHCRLLHGEIKRAIKSFPGKVRVVRKHVPLPNHEHAIGAAIAAVCADAQGRGDVFADAMLTAEDISQEGRELLAGEAGIDMPLWRNCLEAAFARKRVEADVATAKSIGVRGLPTYYIGEQRFTGARRAGELLEALDAAAK